MTGTFASSAIAVRGLPSGVIRVGPATLAAGDVVRLNLPGATALIDPLVPHYPPTIEVSDAATADDVLRELYGDPVADRALALDADDTDSGDTDPGDTDFDDTVLVAFIPSRRLVDLQRLGALVWLARTMPWPLHQTALTAELITLTGACLDLLDDSDDIRDTLQGYSSPLHAAMTTAATSTTATTVTAELVQAASVVCDTLPMASAEQLALRQAIERAVAVADRREQHAASGLESMTRACTPVGAAHAGLDGAGTLFTGAATAEWSRNRPGLVSRDEDAVTWTVDLTTATSADVSVVTTAAAPTPDLALPRLSAAALIRAISDPTWRDPDAVSCSLHSPAWPLPLLEILLTRFPGTGDLTGSGTVRGPLVTMLARALRAGTLTVDVHEAGYRFAHLTAPDPVLEAARRWTNRAVCASRLALAHAEPSHARLAHSAWARAITLWRYTEAADPGLARARIGQCVGWQALVDGDQPANPDDLAGQGPDLPRVISRQDIADVIRQLSLAETLTAGTSTVTDR